MSRKDITLTILKKLYLKKFLSKKEIASSLNCNITTIHKKMAKFSIPRRSQREAIRIAMQKKIIKIPKLKLENLYLKKKLSILKIAEKLNYDRTTIKKELKRHKIPLRTNAAAIKIARNKNKIKKSLLIKLYYRNHFNQKQIAKKFGKNRATILRLMKEYKLKTRKATETQLRYPKSNFSGNLKEKAYLIGFRIGDLNVKLSPSKNAIIVSCTSSKNTQVKLFKKLFNNYGHIWVGKPRNDKNRVFIVRLNRSFDFLLPKQNTIPKWIQKNNNYFFSFLAGYTDAEGCIHIPKNNVARFTLASYDKIILKQIYLYLIKSKIYCKPPKILVKKGHIKSDGYIYRNNHWYFTITKKSSLFLLLQFLKFRLKHQKRLKDLYKAIKNITERNQKFLTC